MTKITEAEPWNVPGKNRTYDRTTKTFVPSDEYLQTQKRKAEIQELLNQIAANSEDKKIKKTLSLLRLVAHILKPQPEIFSVPYIDGTLLALADDAITDIKYECEHYIKHLLENVALSETVQSCLRKQQEIISQTKTIGRLAEASGGLNEKGNH